MLKVKKGILGFGEFLRGWDFGVSWWAFLHNGKELVDDEMIGSPLLLVTGLKMKVN